MSTGCTKQVYCMPSNAGSSDAHPTTEEGMGNNRGRQSQCIGRLDNVICMCSLHDYVVCAVSAGATATGNSMFHTLSYKEHQAVLDSICRAGLLVDSLADSVCNGARDMLCALRFQIVQMM